MYTIQMNIIKHEIDAQYTQYIIRRIAFSSLLYLPQIHINNR
jgi:hypothetical protein